MILTHRRRESIESGITKQSAHALRRVQLIRLVPRSRSANRWDWESTQRADRHRRQPAEFTGASWPGWPRRATPRRSRAPAWRRRQSASGLLGTGKARWGRCGVV